MEITKPHFDVIIYEYSNCDKWDESMNACSMYLMRFIFLPFLMVHVSHVFAASFDCGKVVGVTEKMICNDAKTSALDEKLQQAYRAAMASVSESVDKNALAKEQRNWIQYARANCQSAACLQRIYTARIAMLERNERNIQNDESYCVTPSGDKADVHDCSISAQDYRDPNDHVLIRPGFRRHSRPSLRVAPFKLYRR
ncbi:lysozyme inhibitor LprI family protein, partial [Xanthomonas sp. GPE 39]|uniref:lysozyme inhibitor LprI family protein n=1 Tax=Xanthomonas sp. GPE 39 TaxID=1583099 RepID=UPI0013793494